MKGLTHFISGAAAATFFPEAVQMALEDKSFILVLGGATGIMPDTLDFKFARFFHSFDVEITPDPLNTDAQAIADEIAAGLNAAAEKNKTVSVKMHTMKLSSSMFRRYTVKWVKDPEPAVVVELGPAVSMSKDPVPSYQPIPEEKCCGRAALKLPVVQDYDQAQVIDTFGGPDMAFVPEERGLRMDFIPWHRHWSHSLVLGLMIGLGVYLFGLAVGLEPAWLYGTIAMVGFNVHVLEDQLGVMGSNLYWPFPGARIKGMGIMHSGDAFPNFFFVWLSCILILWNMNRFNPTPPLSLWSFNNPAGWRFDMFFLYTFILPMTGIFFLNKWFRRLDKEPVDAMDDRSTEAMMKDLRDEEKEGFDN